MLNVFNNTSHSYQWDGKNNNRERKYATIRRACIQSHRSKHTTDLWFVCNAKLSSKARHKRRFYDEVKLN